MPILGGIKFVRMDIKTLMRARFIPPSYRKELLLKLQRLHQGSMSSMSVSEYFKELESQMHRVEHFEVKTLLCLNHL